MVSGEIRKRDKLLQAPKEFFRRLGSRPRSRSPPARSPPPVKPAHVVDRQKVRTSLWDTALQQLRDDVKYNALIVEYDQLLEAQAVKLQGNDQETSEQPRKFNKVILLGMENVQSKMWKLKFDPEHPIIIRDQIDRILKVVKKFSGVLSVAANFDPVHAGVAWAGVSAILPLLLNLSDQDAALRAGIEYIADCIAWYAPVERLLLEDRSISPSLAKAILKVYKTVLIYQATATLHLFRPESSRLARDFVAADDWASYLKNIQDADRICQRFVSTESTSMISEQIKDIKKDLGSLIQDSPRRGTILQWLSDTSYADYHFQFQLEIGEQYQNCGGWFLRPKKPGNAYPNWKESTRGQLCLQGSAGTGKSSLFSMVMENLIRDPVPPTLAFHYCKKKVSSDINKIMHSLLSQLLHSSETRAKSSALSSFFQSERRPNVVECVPLIVEAIVQAGPTVIAVDGWDECDTPKALLRYLKDIWNRSTILKLFLSSRVEDGAISSFPDAEVAFCNSDTNYADIKSYIRRELQKPERRNPKVISKELANDMTYLLLRNADGMFLWVKLQLELFISEEYPILSVEEFRRRLQVLSDRSNDESLAMLNDTYQDILKRNLKNQGQRSLDSTKEALMWVGCSGEPLSQNTLVEAVQSNTEDGVSLEQLFQWGRNLLSCDKHGSVRFTHLSVRTFAESFYTMTESHTMAAKISIAYLPHCKGKQNGFAKYACFYWPFHCGRAGLDAGWKSTELGQLLWFLPQSGGEGQATASSQFSSSPGQSSPWDDWISASRNFGSTTSESLKMIYSHDGKQLITDILLLACQFNWLWFLRSLDSESMKRCLVVKNIFGDSCLHLAVRQGHIDLVRHLLAHGFDPNVQAGASSYDCTPLGSATLTNQPIMVRLLLGLDPIDPAPKSLISSGSRGEISRHYSLVNAEAWEMGNTALHLAALHNLPEIAKILLSVPGIDVNVRNDKGATPLLDSAIVGSKEIAATLILNPNVNLTITADIVDTHKYPYASSRVSAIHCTESPAIAKLLLKKEPEIANLAMEDKSTVLGYWLRERTPTGPYADAAYERDLFSRIDLLLKSKRLRNLQMKIGGERTPSALQQAAFLHSVAVFKALWEDKRSNRNETDDGDATLLHIAAAGDNSDVVEFLLANGSDPTEENESGQTAFELAYELGHDKTTKLLRDSTVRSFDSLSPVSR